MIRVFPFRALTLIIFALSFLIAHPAIAKDSLKNNKNQKVATRGLASIKQLRPTLNQTEAMLASPHAAPRLLNKEPLGSKARLGFYGSCRDANGHTVSLADAAYADCLSQSNMPRNDSSVSSFYRSTQREGGAAILISP